MAFKEPKGIEKWIGLEYRKLNQGLVARQVVLTDLLAEAEPSAKTRAGEDYRFDKSSLEKLASLLPDNIQKRLKLPIFFFKDSRVLDSCYLIDDTAAEAFKLTGDINELYRFRDKKMWMGRPIAYEISNKYPTLIQFVVH